MAKNNKHPYPQWTDNIADRVRNRGEGDNAAQHAKDLAKVQQKNDKGNQ